MTGETVAHPVQPGSPANADVHRDPLDAADSSKAAPPAEAPKPRRRPAKKAAAKKKGPAAKS